MSSTDEPRYETLLYQRTGRIARITLDRPERGNGITFDLPMPRRTFWLQARYSL